MSSARVDRVDTGSVAVEEAFAVLVCEDPELLDAEFEAIMTANGFAAAPPVSARPVQDRTRPGDCSRPVYNDDRHRPCAEAVVVQTHRRQRSPP